MKLTSSQNICWWSVKNHHSCTFFSFPSLQTEVELVLKFCITFRHGSKEVAQNLIWMWQGRERESRLTVSWIMWAKNVKQYWPWNTTPHMYVDNTALLTMKHNISYACGQHRTAEDTSSIHTVSSIGSVSLCSDSTLSRKNYSSVLIIWPNSHQSLASS